MLYFPFVTILDMNVKEKRPVITLRRADLIGRVSSKLSGTKAEADAALTAVLDSVQEALVGGNKVVLTGCGTFEIRQVKQRRVRPIRGDGSTVNIPAHERVAFVPGANLKDSISRFGLVDPIIVNSNKDRKNIIVGGHQRVKVAKDMDIEYVPVLEVDLTYEKERELNIRLNKNTGEWDMDVLANMFDMDELVDWGFDEELSMILDSKTYVCQG